MNEEQLLNLAREFVAELARDSHLVNIFDALIERSIERDLESESTSTWPGWRDFYNDYIDGSELELLEKFESKLKPDTRKLLAQVQRVLREADDSKEFNEIIFQGVRAAFLKQLPEAKARELYRNLAANMQDERDEGDEFARDPYKYHGVNRSMFARVVKLAHEHPEFRKLLVPVIRKTQRS